MFEIYILVSEDEAYIFLFSTLHFLNRSYLIWLLFDSIQIYTPTHAITLFLIIHLFIMFICFPHFPTFELFIFTFFALLFISQLFLHFVHHLIFLFSLYSSPNQLLPQIIKLSLYFLTNFDSILTFTFS